jgi:hypothetical protein
MVRTSTCKGKIGVSGACFVASIQGPMKINGGFGELCVVCLFCTPGHACYKAKATLTWVASHLARRVRKTCVYGRSSTLLHLERNHRA